MTTQSSNILLVLANAVANFNGSMSDVRRAANILVSNLGINGFTTQTMGVLVPFKKSLIDLGFNAELVNDFMSRLGVICDCKDKAIGKYTKQHIAAIKSFLKLANQKQAAIENAAHDAEMAAIAQHPVIAPVVAACAKSRELIIELADCNEARFFEICNEVEQIGYSNEILPYALQAPETKAAFGNYEAYINFTVSPFYDRQIDWHITNALKVAADRLNLFLMYNENGEFMNAECDETQGYYAFRVMDNVIGWVLDEPANEPTATAKHPILAELDECLNAQIAAAATTDAITAGDTNGLFVQTANGEWAHVQDAADEADMSVEQYLAFRKSVAVANNCSEFANVENAAAKAGVSLGDYFSLYGDAGWELDFEPMQLEQLQDIYAVAKEQDGDDDDKNSADQLVEQFAKFIHNKIQERHSFFLQKIESIGFQTTAFCYEILLHEQTKISLRVEENGNCYLKHLCAGVGNGSFCSLSFCVYLSQNFEKFFCRKMEAFFRDILRKI